MGAHRPRCLGPPPPQPRLHHPGCPGPGRAPPGAHRPDQQDRAQTQTSAHRRGWPGPAPLRPGGYRPGLPVFARRLHAQFARPRSRQAAPRAADATTGWPRTGGPPTAGPAVVRSSWTEPTAACSCAAGPARTAPAWRHPPAALPPRSMTPPPAATLLRQAPGPSSTAGRPGGQARSRPGAQDVAGCRAAEPTTPSHRTWRGRTLAWRPTAQDLAGRPAAEPTTPSHRTSPGKTLARRPTALDPTGRPAAGPTATGPRTAGRARRRGCGRAAQWQAARGQAARECPGP